MENLKISVKSEADIQVCRSLFEQLGYVFTDMSFVANPSSLQVFSDGSGSLFEDHDSCCNEEITREQLKEKVILHRNNVNDANHTDQDGWKWFISSTGVGYVFAVGNAENIPRWDESSLDHVELKPIHKPLNDLNLISYANALIAIAYGKRVQYRSDEHTGWQNDIANLKISDFGGGHYEFRLKPKPLIIGDIEVPAPVSPDTQALPEDTDFWIADPSCHDGKFAQKSKWDGAKSDQQYLKRGLVHLKEADAIAHGKALILVSGGSID